MAGNPTGIAAFVEAFGNSFAHVNNQRIQQQLAIKHSQDSAIAETLIKSGMEDPTLWENENFAGPAKKVLGAQNAKAIAEIAKQYAASPMGVLRRGFGAEALTRPDVPPEGPVFNPQALDARPEAINAVVAPRISGQTPIETGLGFDSQTGFLQAKTQALATKPTLNAEGLTPAQAKTFQLQEERAATQKGQFEQTFAQRERDVQRRAVKTKAELAAGTVRMLETSLGPVQVREVFNPTSQQLEIVPIARKREKPPAAMLEKFQNLNTGLRYTDDISDFIDARPEEAANALVPFVGKRLSEINENIGGLTPRQQRFVRQLKNLAISRVSFQAGRALTGTEMQYYEGVLPSLNVANVETLKLLTQDTREALTAIGADQENVLDKFGYRVPPDAVTRQSKRNRDFYKHIRKRMPEFPTGVPSSTPAPQANVESELDSLDAVLSR